MAMSLSKEVLCFENLQIGYCENHRNIPGCAGDKTHVYKCVVTRGILIVI